MLAGEIGRLGAIEEQAHVALAALPGSIQEAIGILEQELRAFTAAPKGVAPGA